MAPNLPTFDHFARSRFRRAVSASLMALGPFGLWRVLLQVKGKPVGSEDFRLELCMRELVEVTAF